MFQDGSSAPQTPALTRNVPYGHRFVQASPRLRSPNRTRGVQIRSGAIRGDLPQRRPYGQGRRHRLGDARGCRLLRVGFCPPSAGNVAARPLPSQLRKAIPQGPSGRVCSSVSGCRALPRRRWLTCPRGFGRFLTEGPGRVQDRCSKHRGHADRLRVLNPSSIRPRLPTT